MFDDNLTMAGLGTLFTTVNRLADETGEDDDAQQLNYDEFVQVVVRVANVKFPESVRGGEPFESTLQSFLGLIFIPTCRKLLKEKAKGTRAKSMK